MSVHSLAASQLIHHNTNKPKKKYNYVEDKDNQKYRQLIFNLIESNHNHEARETIFTDKN